MPRTLTERVTELDQNFVSLRERMSAMDDIKADRLEVAHIRQEIALLRQRFDDQQRRAEEWDRRRWGLGGMFAAATLTFIANLIVAWVNR